MPALANRMDEAVAAARDQATCYGSGAPLCVGPGGLRDIQHFAQNLRSKVTDPSLIAAIDRLGETHGALVMQRVFEPGQWGGMSYGLGTLFNTSSANPAEVGDFQYDSNWKLVLDRLTEPQSPTKGFLSFSPLPATLPIGQTVTIEARLSSRVDSPACPIPVAWTVEGNAVSATSGMYGTRLNLVANHAGVARITATYNGINKTFSLGAGGLKGDGSIPSVDAVELEDADAAGTPSGPRSLRTWNAGPAGCACGLSSGTKTRPSFWWMVVFLGLAKPLRRWLRSIKTQGEVRPK